MLHAFLRGSWAIARGFGRFLDMGLAKPLRAIGIIVFKHGLVHLYRAYLIAKNALKSFFSPAKNKILFPLMKRGILHILLVIIAAGVIFTNLNVHTGRAETLGQGTLMGTLVPPEEADTVETITKIPQKHVSYLGDFASAQYESGQGTDQDQGPLSIADTSGALIQPTLPSTTQSGAARDQVEYYIVQGGDTSSTIAEKFGISTNTLLWENRLGPSDVIKPGQKLTILPTSGLSYQVQKNDTLASIAKKLSADENTIIDYNQLANADAIELGQILIVPGGKPPEQPAQPRTQPSAPSTAVPSQVATGPIPPSARAPVGSRFLWPTTSHRINQYFKGYRHTGLDIDGDYSSPIWAAADGTVELVAYQNYGYGYHIIINHGGGFKTLYGHASKIFVKQGQHVDKGQTIAIVGSTGRSTGTHVHFEVIINGQKVNPLSYL